MPRLDAIGPTASGRTAELRRINAALVAANEELETFSSSVSHELRTPLRAINGFSRILLEDYGDTLADEPKRLVTAVHDSAAKMNRLIDELLAFSGAGRVEMNRTLVDMEALVREALAGPLAPALAGRTITVAVGRLPPAYGDRAMLERVWTNLLDNAIKFTGPNTEARIAIDATVIAGETVYFVRDNGIGFDMRCSEKLFGIFQRLHGRDIPGTGVGLALVKRLIGRLGGRVWGEGAVGEGATFSFTLSNGGGE